MVFQFSNTIAAMSNVLPRALAILERLAHSGEGMELAALASALQIPRSATHRLLAELVELGFVRQTRELGEYRLSTKLASLGLSWLSQSGISDFAQPLLDHLAEVSGELVRLSVIDGDRLTWVARAQGARQGLRYDPDMGSDARLSCSSSGWAVLSVQTEVEALRWVKRQGLGRAAEYGPNAPRTQGELMQRVAETRKRGWAITTETYSVGLNAIAAPVVRSGRALGAITIAGPSVRFDRKRMEALGPELLAIAQQMAAASGSSAFFQSAVALPKQQGVAALGKDLGKG